jgi:uncharacterized protein (UPF0262 family)
VDGLIRESVFQPAGDTNGPYRILFADSANHIVLSIKNANGISLPSFGLSTSPYRRIMHDYFLMIESYEQARIEGSRSRLEAIDMGRRGLHDEAGGLLIDRLKDRVLMDHPGPPGAFSL